MPREIVASILKFLLPTEVVQMTTLNRRFYYELSAKKSPLHSRVWSKIISDEFGEEISNLR